MVADCFYGDNPGFTDALGAAKVPFVLALKPRKGTWAPADQPTPRWRRPATSAGTAPAGLGGGGGDPRRFRDGPRRDLVGGRRPARRLGPGRRLRLVVATTDPGRLPGHSTWYLVTNLPRPRHAAAPSRPTWPRWSRLYGLRNWVEQGYKQVKGELGWADFQVRSDRAIRRHWALVCCAFSFCWRAWFAEHPAQPAAPDPQAAAPTAARGAPATGHRGGTGRRAVVAGGAAPGAGLAWAVERAAALLAGVVASAPAPAATTAA